MINNYDNTLINGPVSCTPSPSSGIPSCFVNINSNDNHDSLNLSSLSV